jgi:arylsulfatase A-like enzyme
MKQDGDKPSIEVNKGIFKWLDKNKDTPFFMFIDYTDPHGPFTLGREYRTTNVTRSHLELYRAYIDKKRYDDISKDIINDLINLYDPEIMYIDHHIGKLLNKMDELDIKNNTIIIITADHGIEFYEHGYFDKGETMYQEIIHVPLIFYYPKEFKPQRIEKSVSNTDIMPTILGLLKIEVPVDIDGMSLVPLVKNGSYNRKYVASEAFGRLGIEETEQQIAIISGDWKLIEVRPKTETIPSALYNLRTDPKEQRNLYNIYTKKRNELQKYISEVTDPNIFNITGTS